MTTARRTGNQVVIEADLPQGTSLYVDADWLPDEHAREKSVTVTALRVDEDAARAAIAGVAREAVQAAGGGTAEVIGRGAVAALTRSMLNRESVGRDVDTIIDASGSVERILGALEALPELGTLVLAGEAGDAPANIDVYRLLHLRGVKVIGVARPLVAPAAEEASLPAPMRVVAGEPFEDSAPWYEVRSPSS